MSPGHRRAASISEKKLDLYFTADKHKCLCFKKNRLCCHHCSAKQLRNTRIPNHVPTDKSLLYNKTPLTRQETSVHSVVEGKKKSRLGVLHCSHCNTNTLASHFLPALTTVFSNGNRQVKYDKPMAWSLSPESPLEINAAQSCC